MKKTFILLPLTLLIFNGCGPFKSGFTDPSTLEVLSSNAKIAYSEALDCSEESIDNYKEWCAVTKLGENALETPSSLTTYIGLTIVIDTNREIDQGYLESSSVAVLHLDDASALLTDLTPSNEAEEKELMELKKRVINSLKGSAEETIKLPVDALDFIMADNETRNRYELTKSSDEKSASYNGSLESKLYYVPGVAYVVIEDFGQGLAYVSVFSLDTLTK